MLLLQPGRLLVLAAATRAPSPGMMATDAAVVAHLNQVPIFGIAVAGEGKLYTDDDSGAMIYTHLCDATRVLGRLQAAYPTTDFELQPLELGTVLRRLGVVGEGGGRSWATLVGSPDERRAARGLSLAPAPASATAAAATGVTVFHVGALEQNGQERAEGAVWPFLFRFEDVATMWTELGGAATLMPPVSALDLSDLIPLLRGSGAEAQPGKPVLCPPLDAVQYLREWEREAARHAAQQVSADGALAGEAPDGQAPDNLGILLGKKS